jgi:uncharacterized protein YdhG (YjbR/CyaY superfamily)
MTIKKKAQTQNSKAVDADASGVAAVEQYLSSLGEPAHTTLITVRERIRAHAPPEATEGFGYGVPAFRCEALLAGYAAGKKFCSYYPMSGRVIHDLKEQLKDYSTTSGAIHFPLDKPLPASLIKKLVQARLEQIRKPK